MRRSFLNMLVVAGGLCLVISGLSLWLGAAPAQAQGQPPPRPTLTPVPPTRVRDSDDSSPTAVPAGRITGTVIDQTTGAPAPNIAVAVGDKTVVTDANGNYDRSGLPAGDYIVALAAEQGLSAQEPVVIVLASGATVVQHLVFRSPAAVVPTPTPTAAPAALPITGVADSGAWGAFVLGIVLLGLGVGLRGRKARAAQ